VDNVGIRYFNGKIEECIASINSEPILNAMCNMFNLNLQSSSENKVIYKHENN
jgi:hypothetical protein